MTFEETLQIAWKTAIWTAAISFIANAIFGIIKVKFNLFEEKTVFNKKHNYNQLCNLYLNLYAIIAQSEYVRYFHNIDDDFSEIPFIEISRTRFEQKIEFKSGEYAKIFNKELTINNAVTEFTKEKIQQLILENAKFSSQKLLKLAVAHRYVAQHYIDNTIKTELLERFQLEEVVLIKCIVETVVKETNLYLKNCNMNYNTEELSTGILINGTID